jgi:short subunit dehydrogenase-like uncharacterized protein
MASSAADASPRDYDITIFGASGFTGAFVTEALARLLATPGHPALPSTPAPLRVALAGRSGARLREVQERALAAAPALPRERLSILLADVGDAASLAAMARSSRLLLNCVGPFRLHGEPVVAACVSEGCHYLDITGEPEFMERMELRYGEEAARAGLCIVPCSAFDSIPADLGVAFAVQQLAERCGGAAATSVSSYLTLRTGRAGFGGHFATYESAVLGFASVAELQRTRRAYALRYPHLARVPLPGAPPRKRGAWFARGPHWALPFPGSDASVVRRSQRALHAARLLAAGEEGGSAAPALPLPQPVHYEAFFTVASTWSLCLSVLFGGALSLLAPWAWGRRLLLAAPGLFSGGIFSHAGPTAAQLAETSFEMEFVARGSGAGEEARCVVRGPEPGYVATPALLLGAALTLLEVRGGGGGGGGGSGGGAFGACPGGVLTPASAFRGTALLQRLRALGVSFDALPAGGL